MATVQTTDKVIQAIDNGKGRYAYYYLLKHEPMINWHKFASELYQVSSSDTILGYCRAICRFRSMLGQKTIADALTEMRSNNGLVYQYLADFVTFCLVNKGYSAGTARLNLAVVKRLLVFENIEFDEKKLHYKVKLPKKRKLKDEWPTNEVVKAILNAATFQVRTFLLVMLDTGLEPTDLTQLKPKNFDFASDPVTVSTVREKTGEEIQTFVSKDTAQAVKQLIESQQKTANDYIFAKKFGFRAIQHMRDGYNLALARAGFGKVAKRDNGQIYGIPDKIEGHNFGKYHLKVYKKRWFTMVESSGVPVYVAQGMLGRHAYLDDYFRLPQDKKLEFGKRILKIVSVYGDKADKQEVINKAAEIIGVDASMLDETKLQAFKGLMSQFAALPADKLTEISQILAAGHKKP